MGAFSDKCGLRDGYLQLVIVFGEHLQYIRGALRQMDTRPNDRPEASDAASVNARHPSIVSLLSQQPFAGGTFQRNAWLCGALSEIMAQYLCV